MATTAPPGGGSSADQANQTTAAVDQNGTQLAGPDPNSWEAQFLKDLQDAVNQKYGSNLQIPVTSTNVAILDAWTASEGTLNANNPFAISTVMPGATKCIAQCGTSSPVMAYDTLTQGLQNTADWMVNNGYDAQMRPQGYATFAQFMAQSKQGESSLQAAQVARNVFDVINQSKWCAGCQGGNYPEGLLKLIQNFERGITPSQAGAANPTSATGIAGDYAKAAANTVTSWTGSLGKILGKLTDKNFWIRVGLFAAGLVLALIGVSFILSESKTVTSVAGAALAAPL